ncbi:MAG: twin-arginine translocase subunit TatB [Rhizobiales bacterium]|nr:twin-arginine translocase subunit TatB [Hyphomicrobiales bacterium]
MFDIGWTEMLVIAVVMIVVVGPKDLPKMLRTFGKTTAKLRVMAGDFQRQFNEALKEAELDDVKKSVDELRSLNPANQIRQTLNPFEKAAADVRAGLQSLNPATPPKPDSAAPAAEPAKDGTAAAPDAAVPMESPAPPAAAAAAMAAEPLKKGATTGSKGGAGRAAGKAAPAGPARKAAAKASATKTATKPAPAARKAAPAAKPAKAEKAAAPKPGALQKAAKPSAAAAKSRKPTRSAT